MRTILAIRMAKLRKLGIVRNQSGFALIEAILGIGLLGIIVVAVLMGVSTSHKVNAAADKQSTAESLALSQIESLQFQTYQVAATDGEVTYTQVAGIPSNFSICSYNRAGTVVSSIVGVPWASSTDGTAGVAVAHDVGLQKIRLVIKQGSNVALTLEIYKVQ